MISDTCSMSVVFLFLIIVRLLIRAEIERTEHMLIEVQDYSVQLRNLPQLSSNLHQYNLTELKAAVYLWLRDNISK